MADRTRRLPQNIAGDFFVDDSCIDCDTCRQIAPTHFRDHGDQSSVYQQPETAAEISQALKALVSCPTSSIGTLTKHDLRRTVASFPSLISENVYFCGFTSESSYGAWSYLIARPKDQRTRRRQDDVPDA
jgi:ferredoxin